MCLNISLYHGEVPSSWKFAHIVPIEKKTGGFRPISLIDSLAKIVENVVYWRWTKQWPELAEVIPENQYARKLGCPAAIASLMDYVESSRYTTYVVFLDIAKAFDRVHIPTLVRLLRDSGCPAYTVRWIGSFLTNRKAGFVDANGVLLEEWEMENGIPQGSVLAPLLYQIYVRSVLADIPNVQLSGYADDTSLACHMSTPDQTARTLNAALAVLLERFKALGIEVNPGKSQAMWLRPQARAPEQPNVRLEMAGTRIGLVAECLYLGVTFNNRLTFRGWIQKKLEVLKERSNHVFRLWALPKKMLRVLWNGYACSALMYCLGVVWQRLGEDMKTLVRNAYNRNAKMIAGVYKNTNVLDSLREAGMQPLEARMSIRGGERAELLELNSFDLCKSPTPTSRRCEFIFSRWRVNSVATHESMRKRGLLKEDVPCRYCGHLLESRWHILDECPALENWERQNLRGIVEATEGIPWERIELGTVLCLNRRPGTGSNRVARRYAKALSQFLDSVEFHS
jgi:hypothetical protein